jgi:hypothetical protein
MFRASVKETRVAVRDAEIGREQASPSISARDQGLASWHLTVFSVFGRLCLLSSQNFNDQCIW